jgi:hypothetical protein
MRRGRSFATSGCMVNNDRNRKYQPATGQGKHQFTHLGEPRKLGKRSEVVRRSAAIRS